MNFDECFLASSPHPPEQNNFLLLIPFFTLPIFSSSIFLSFTSRCIENLLCSIFNWIVQCYLFRLVQHPRQRWIQFHTTCIASKKKKKTSLWNQLVNVTRKLIENCLVSKIYSSDVVVNRKIYSKFKRLTLPAISMLSIKFYEA